MYDGFLSHWIQLQVCHYCFSSITFINSVSSCVTQNVSQLLYFVIHAEMREESLWRASASSVMRDPALPRTGHVSTLQVNDALGTQSQMDWTETWNPQMTQKQTNSFCKAMFLSWIAILNWCFFFFFKLQIGSNEKKTGCRYFYTVPHLKT